MLDYDNPSIQSLIKSSGYGVAVSDFQNLMIDWNCNNTYIQSEGISQDFGVYNSPDELLKEHHQEMSPMKAFAYRNLGRHLMNRNLSRIRNAKGSFQSVRK